jgi:hypothetical protein
MIPRVVHQIWIGSTLPPSALIASWQEFCSSRRWAHRLWNDEKHSLFDPVRDVLDAMSTVGEKAELMRYVILENLGGVYADADTMLIRPLDDNLLIRDFCSFEHELVRPRLFAATIMGFEPAGAVTRHCIDVLSSHSLGSPSKRGSSLLTEAISVNHLRRLRGAKLRDVRALAARHFNPVHWTGAPAPGVNRPRNGRVDPAIYATHRWYTAAASGRAHATPTSVLQPNVIAMVEKIFGIDDESLSRRVTRNVSGIS